MNLELAHEFCSDHRALIERSVECGCFYCGRTFNPSDIKEWIDAGQTALCPKCGIDAVLPAFWNLTTSAFLKRMHDYWFTGGLVVEYKDGKEVSRTHKSRGGTND